MIPSVIILAYFHGSPGKDKWGRIEKIGIPCNVLLSIIILFVVFYPKDLGAATKTIIIETDDGKRMKRIIPKSEFIKSFIGGFSNHLNSTFFRLESFQNSYKIGVFNELTNHQKKP